MVRQATETAVSASISTPVWPVTLTVACTTKPGSACSGSMSTATLVIGSGWQSGISSCVRLAAMMPAMPRGAEHVALLGVAGEHEVERLWRHDDAAFGDRDALGRGLGRDIDHARLAALVEMA